MGRKTEGAMEPQGIIHRRISELVPYARNARTHSPVQIAQIKALIREYGFTNPVLADATGIIAGHGRVLAASEIYAAGELIYAVPGKAAGAQPIPANTLPTLDCTGWTDAQRRAYIIADNQVAMQAGWDTELLKIELESLQADGLDMDLLGFDDVDLAGFMADSTPDGKGKTDPDDIPGLRPEIVSRTGDIWLMGGHRIGCMDSTGTINVAQLMAGERAALMQTDPPYGIAYVQNAKTKGQAVAHADIENDELDGPKLQAFLEGTIRAAVPCLNDDAAFYLWHPMLTQGTFFAAAAAAADILIHRQIIWCKPSMVFGRGDYHWQHELAFYGWRRGNRPPFYGPRNQTTIWQIARETQKEHPTAKPVELWLRPIENHTKRGEIVYEPFAGAGSQIICAEMNGRRCFALEMSAGYVDVCVRRWQAYTGKKATRLSDGVEFDSIKPSVATQ